MCVCIYIIYILYIYIYKMMKINYTRGENGNIYLVHTHILDMKKMRPREIKQLFHYLFLVAITNGIFCVISVSDISLLVYKNAFNFWILTFYPTFLPNSLIRSNSFLVKFMEFSMYTIMSSANNDSFTSSFPIWMPFIFFLSYHCG